MMPDRYKTLARRAEAEINVKKSRFLATAAPVADEEAARAFVEELRKRFWNATHNVFAWRVQAQAGVGERFSDDGEPGGTAGRPVLDVLRGEDLLGAAVVVTRWFGGTKLGAGGLVRAYTQSAQAGIAAAGISERVLCREFRVKVDYSILGKIQHELREKGYILRDTKFTDEVALEVLVEVGKTSAFINEMNEITSGEAEIEEGKETYTNETDQI